MKKLLLTTMFLGTSLFLSINQIKACTVAPSVPSSLTYSAVDCGTFTLSWIPSTGSPAGYIVTIATDQYFTHPVDSFAITTNTFQRNVSGGNTYYCRIRAYNACGWSSTAVSNQYVKKFPTSVTVGDDYIVQYVNPYYTFNATVMYTHADSPDAVSDWYLSGSLNGTSTSAGQVWTVYGRAADAGNTYNVSTYVPGCTNTAIPQNWTPNDMNSAPMSGRTGIIEENSNQTSSSDIFPNPASSFFTVKTLSAQYKLKIFNNLGSEVLAKEGKSGEQLNISSLPAGAYIVKINDGSQEITKKLEVIR